MRKLIRVAKTPEVDIHFPELRVGAQGIKPVHYDGGNDYYRQIGEFFIVEERDLKTAVDLLAAENPGKEVQVYDLASISICPAAPMITKQVGKDGILPQM